MSLDHLSLIFSLSKFFLLQFEPFRSVVAPPILRLSICALNATLPCSCLWTVSLLLSSFLPHGLSPPPCSLFLAGGRAFVTSPCCLGLCLHSPSSLSRTAPSACSTREWVVWFLLILVEFDWFWLSWLNLYWILVGLLFNLVDLRACWLNCELH